MNISYTKIDPAGNITVIVDSFVPRKQQSRVASELMKRDVTVEQVGFLEKPDASLLRRASSDDGRRVLRQRLAFGRGRDLQPCGLGQGFILRGAFRGIRCCGACKNFRAHGEQCLL